MRTAGATGRAQSTLADIDGATEHATDAGEQIC